MIHFSGSRARRHNARPETAFDRVNSTPKPHKKGGITLEVYMSACAQKLLILFLGWRKKIFKFTVV
jgi:hypothetical protein